MEIKYELTKTPKEKPTGALGFGHIFTDHMFVMDYDEGKGWHDARIVPYQPLVLDPSALVFHYAQECFEGLKAVSYTHLDVYKRQQVHSVGHGL